MSSFIYQVLASTSLLSLGLYHLISTIRNQLKSPQTFSAKPFHPLSLSSTTTTSSHIRLLPLYFTITALLISFLHSSLSSTLPDPLILGHSPVHHFLSLHSAAISLLFLLLSFFLLLSQSTSLFSLLPDDLFFALASAVFFLSSSASSTFASLQTSLLQSHLSSLSSTISLSSSLLSLFIALFPRVFVLDIALASSVCLQGLWALQTGLSLYVEAFIPEGCHRLLDVVSGVEGSTKCELEESKLRAVAILDLAFVIYFGVVMVLIFIIYAVVSKALGISRRFGAYEVLPTAADINQVQLKTLSGTQA